MTRRFEDEASLVAWGRRAGAGLRRGDCVFLIGDLGAGKTTLVRALSEGLGVDAGDVASPTFAVHHMYEGQLPVHHLDGYRLEQSAEYDQVGLDCLPEGVLFIEWPQKFTLRRPTATVTITIDGAARDLEIDAAPDHPLAAPNA